MSRLPFQTCEFVTSSDGNVFPRQPWPHLALVGRSNVGKSSLVNHIFQKKALAKVSSVPGKTRLVNFFLVDQKLFLVDLPGFGYAKISNTEKVKFEEMIERYVDTFEDKIHFLHLLDSKLGLTPFDNAFIEWAQMHGKKIFFIFTKMDKINKSERKSVEAKLREKLPLDSDVLFYSIKEKEGRNLFLSKISDFLCLTEESFKLLAH